MNTHDFVAKSQSRRPGALEPEPKEYVPFSYFGMADAHWRPGASSQRGNVCCRLLDIAHCHVTTNPFGSQGMDVVPNLKIEVPSFVGGDDATPLAAEVFAWATYSRTACPRASEPLFFRLPEI